MSSRVVSAQESLLNRAPSERSGILAEFLAIWEEKPLDQWSDRNEMQYLGFLMELERDCFFAQDDSDPGLVDVLVTFPMDMEFYFFHLRVEPDETMFDIKKKVGYLTDVEPFDQDIYLGGVRMMDYEPLPPAEAGHIALNVCRLVA